MNRPLVKTLKSLLTALIKTSVAPPVAAHPPPAAVSIAPAEAAFKDQLQQLATNADGGVTEVLAGSVVLVGLAEIRDKLGAQWPAMASRAKAIAEAAIKLHMPPPDFFLPHGDEGFVLCFKDPNKAAGDDKVRSIADTIQADLRREIPAIAASLSIEAFVAQVDSATLLDGQGLSAVGLFSALQTMRAEAHAAEQALRAAMLRNVSVIFQPAWDPQATEIAFNLSMLGSSYGDAMLKHLEAISEPEALTRALGQLDCLVLTRALQALHKSLQARHPTVIVVPVQFETLSRCKLRAEYLQLCEAMPPPYQKFVMLEVLNAPVTGDLERVQQVLTLVQPAVGSLVLQVWPLDQTLAKPLAAIVAGVSLKLPTFGIRQTEKLRRRLKGYVTTAAANNLFTLAHGANSVAQVQIAAELGFAFIAGGAVHETTDIPKALLRHNPFPSQGATPTKRKSP